MDSFYTLKNQPFKFNFTPFRFWSLLDKSKKFQKISQFKNHPPRHYRGSEYKRPRHFRDAFMSQSGLSRLTRVPVSGLPVAVGWTAKIERIKSFDCGINNFRWRPTRNRDENFWKVLFLKYYKCSDCVIFRKREILQKNRKLLKLQSVDAKPICNF